MKNKKLLSRILALTSALILVVALAVPCFADEMHQNELLLDSEVTALVDYVYGYSPYDSVIDPFVAFDDPYAFSNSPVGFWVKPWAVTGTFMGTQNVRYLLNDCSVLVYHPEHGNFVLQHTGIVIDVCMWGDSIEICAGDSDELILEYDVSYYNVDITTYTTYTFDDLYIYGRDYEINGLELFVLIYDKVTYMDNLVELLTTDNAGIFYPSAFIEGYYSNDVTNSPSTPNEPTRSGMFGQLYYILSDAIYGEGVTLDPTQDLALTLVCTLLVLCTVLLPVLLVVGIMIKVFRW